MTPLLHRTCGQAGDEVLLDDSERITTGTIAMSDAANI
jgi:hypothetical protein